MNLDTEFARKNMIQQQVRCWGVSSPRVLGVLKNVPREHFVPEQYASLAFADVMLPLDKSGTGHERKMLNPKLEGRILQELNLQPTDCALVIGTGSGYLTACLAKLTRHVTSIDSSAEMINKAGQHLDDLGIANVELRVQDMFDRPTAARFDVIAVTGSLPVYDSRIEAWLKPGGRAFVVVGTAPAMEACLVERSNKDEISYRSLFETVIPPLANVPLPASTEFPS
jgi:protein-L-isoaspartate(D-aspartate) O-methyltransferase